MRPNSIIWFERLIFGTLCLGALQSYLNWQGLIATASNTKVDPVAFVLTIQISAFAIISVLTLRTSRRRSKVAKWLSIALFVLGIPASIGIFASGVFVGLVWIAALQTVAQFIAYGLLFTPSSRRWLNRDEPS